MTERLQILLQITTMTDRKDSEEIVIHTLDELVEVVNKMPDSTIIDLEVDVYGEGVQPR